MKNRFVIINLSIYVQYIQFSMESEVTQKYIDTLRKLNYELVKELRLFQPRANLSFSQRHILYHISNHKGLSILDLANLLHLNHSTMSRNIKRLQQAGLIEIQQLETDKRYKIIQLTLSGYKSLQAATVSINETIFQALNKLTETEIKSIIHNIELYCKVLKQ